MGGDKLLPKVCDLDAASREGKRVSARRQEIFLIEYLPHLRPCRGAEELLDLLAARGHKAAAATSAKKDELDPLLKVCGADRVLPAATSSDDAEESKPDPDILHAALKEIGLPATDVVMLGDTPYDVEAARRGEGDWPAVRRVGGRRPGGGRGVRRPRRPGAKHRPVAG